jgi:hypothetical protein
VFASTLYGRVRSLGIQGCIHTAGETFEKLAKRELLAPENSLQVDPGYEVYAGVANSTTQINSFKGEVAHSSSILLNT